MILHRSDREYRSPACKPDPCFRIDAPGRDPDIAPRAKKPDLDGDAINLAIALSALFLVRSSLDQPGNVAATGPSTAIPTFLPRWLTGLVQVMRRPGSASSTSSGGAGASPFTSGTVSFGALGLALRRRR